MQGRRKSTSFLRDFYPRNYFDWQEVKPFGRHASDYTGIDPAYWFADGGWEFEWNVEIREEPPNGH